MTLTGVSLCVYGIWIRNIKHLNIHKRNTIIKLLKHVCSSSYNFRNHLHRFTAHDMDESFNTVYGVMVMFHNAIELMPNWNSKEVQKINILQINMQTSLILVKTKYCQLYHRYDFLLLNNSRQHNFHHIKLQLFACYCS